MIAHLIKRDGRVVDFNSDNITQAIMKAVNQVGGTDKGEAKRLTDIVVANLETMNLLKPKVDIIQDTVEKVLIEEGHAKTAKAYILFRSDRDRVREMSSSLMRSYEELTFGSSTDVEIKRENANIDGDTAMGTMLRYGSEGAKQFNLMYLVRPEFSRAHKHGDIHIHDLDFLALTETCLSGQSELRLYQDKGLKPFIERAHEIDGYFKEGQIGAVDISAENIWVDSWSSKTKVKNVARYKAKGKQMYTLFLGREDIEIDLTGEHRVPVSLIGEFDYGEQEVDKPLQFSIETEGQTWKIKKVSELTEDDCVLLDMSGYYQDDECDTSYSGCTATKEKREINGKIMDAYTCSTESCMGCKHLKYGAEIIASRVAILGIRECTEEEYVYDIETDNHYFNTTYMVVHNCCQIDLEKLFERGFNTGHGFLREPGEIRSYAALACIAIQSNQNDMHKRVA